MLEIILINLPQDIDSSVGYSLHVKGILIMI